MKKQLRTILNQEKALEHLKLANGNVELACINAELSTSQFYKWAKVDDDFKNRLIEVYQNFNSYANAKLTRIEIDKDESALWKLKRMVSKKLESFLNN
jgi:hypothetical protein